MIFLGYNELEFIYFKLVNECKGRSKKIYCIGFKILLNYSILNSFLFVLNFKRNF